MTERITIGLMSGTSLDGTDAVAMAFDGRVMRSLGHSSLAFPPNLRAALAALTLPGPDEIERMGEASVALARHYAEATGLLLARTGLSPADVAALGVHGQTIRHRPQKGFTLQLNHPALVAELTGIDVVADLRSRDVAAGGEGAPLVPAFHAECFTGDVPRVVLNIGGIANISVLPARSESPTILGGDTGPGNMLIDTWTQRITGALYDRDGRWAASGRVSTTLLDNLLSEPYFALPIPKSTGRELFSPAWLDARLCGHESLPPEDVARALVELTARTITNTVARFAPDAAELYVCGGGVYNKTLMQAIASHFPGLTATTEALGVPPMEVEAAALRSAFSQASPETCLRSRGRRDREFSAPSIRADQDGSRSMKKRTAFAWNVVRLFLCRRAFGPPASDSEGGAAAAGRHRIGIVDDELSAAQVVLEVDLGADEVLVAHGIDEKRHTALFHHGVVGVLDLVERKAVLEAGAAAALNEHAQLEAGIALFVHQLLDLRDGGVGEVDGIGHELGHFFLRRFNLFSHRGMCRPKDGPPKM